MNAVVTMNTNADCDKERGDGEVEDASGRRNRTDEILETVPSVSAALVKSSAGELRTMRWNGRVSDADAKDTG
jgi:hypothetical protein